MRLNLVLLAATAASLASCGNVSASTGVDQTKLLKIAPVDHINAFQNAGTTTRFLRSGQPVDDDSDDLDEDLDDVDERGGIGTNIGTAISQHLKEFSQLDDTAKTALKRFRKANPTLVHKEVGAITNGRQTLKSAIVASRVGRENQRFSRDGRRLLTCAVVSHPQKGIGGDVLLISSSGMPGKWILPKGGWEKDETAWVSAVREVDEEAGVVGTFVGNLGKLNFDNRKGLPHRYYGFEMQAKRINDDWAENFRDRTWVTYREAKKLLQDEPHMVKMVARAELANLRRVHKVRAARRARKAIATRKAIAARKARAALEAGG